MEISKLGGEWRREATGWWLKFFRSWKKFWDISSFMLYWYICYTWCQTSNISGTLVGNKLVDHSDVVGASPVGAAPTTSSFWIYTRDLIVHIADAPVEHEGAKKSSLRWPHQYRAQIIHWGTTSLSAVHVTETCGWDVYGDPHERESNGRTLLWRVETSILHHAHQLPGVDHTLSHHAQGEEKVRGHTVYILDIKLFHLWSIMLSNLIYGKYNALYGAWFFLLISFVVSW